MWTTSRKTLKKRFPKTKMRTTRPVASRSDCMSPPTSVFGRTGCRGEVLGKRHISYATGSQWGQRANASTFTQRWYLGPSLCSVQPSS